MLPNEKKDLLTLKTDLDDSGPSRITPKLLRDWLVSTFGSRHITELNDSADLDENMDVLVVDTLDSGCYLRLPRSFGQDGSALPFAEKQFSIVNIGKYAINLVTYSDDILHDGTQLVTIAVGARYEVLALPTSWMWTKVGSTNIVESTEDAQQNVFVGKPSVGNALPEYSSTAVVAQHDNLVVAIGKLDKQAAPQIISIEARYPIGGHRLVEVGNDGRWVYSQSGNAVALTLGACGTGEIPAVINTGMVVEPSWNWTTGLPIYQTGLGMLTQVVPTSDFIRQVATAMSPTSLLLEFKQTIIVG